MATVSATLQIYDRFSSPLKDYASGLKNAAQASSGLKGAVANAVNGMSFQKPKSELDQLGNQVEKTGGLFKTMLGANVIGTGISKAIGAVTSSIGDAVKRVDTLNNASRAFENMGFSAKETKGAMNGLDKSITGLPTSMDVAVKNTQLLAASTGDIGKSVNVFKAMNDGILGFGGTSAQVENAVVQLSQAFSNGKVDAETWNSMIDSGMGPSLNALAKTMGKTTGQFKEGLSKGTISVDAFQDALIDLDKNGGGGMKSLNQIAQDSTAGFATSMTNMKTAVTRGVAGIINGFSKGGLVEFMNKITDGIKAMVPTFEAFGAKAGQVFSRVVKGIGEFWQAFKNTGAVTAIMGAFYSIKGAIDAIMSALKSTDSKSLFTIKNAAEAVGNAVVWAANQVDNFATFIQRLDPNIIQAIATAAGIAFTIFMGWKAITGVIGGVSGAITGLSGAFTGIGSAMGFVVKHPILSTIILLAGAFVYAYTTSEKFRDGVNKIAGAIGKAVSAISDWIGKNKGMASGMAWGTAYGVIIFALYKKFQLLKNPLSAVSGILKTFGKAKSSGLTKMAADASKTTSAVTNLKNKLTGGLNFAIKAVGFAAVIGSLALLAKSLEGIANAGAQAPANLATFGAVVAGLAGTFALFGSKLQSSMTGIAVFAASMSVLALSMAPLANAGAGAATNMAIFGAVIGGLAAVFAVFGSALTANMVGIGVFAASVSILALSMAPIAQTGTAGAIAMMAFGLVVAGLVTVFALFGGALTVAIPAMLAFGATILMIGAGIGMAAPGLAMLPPIIMALGMAFSMAAMAVASAITMIIGAVAGLVTTIAGAIMGIVDTIGNTLVNVFQQAGDSISQVVTSIGDSISQVVTAISDGVSQIVDSVGGAVTGILNSLAKVFDSIGTAALNAGKGFQLLADGITQLVNLSLVDLGMTLAAVAKGLGAIALSGPGLIVAGSGMTLLGVGTMLFATAAMVANASMAPLTAAIQTLSTTLPLIGTAAAVAGAAMGVFAATVLISLASLIGATAILIAFMAVMTMTGATMGIVSALAMVASAGFLMFGAAATIASVMVTLLNLSLMMLSMSAMIANTSLTAMISSLTMVGIGLVTITSVSLVLIATLTIISATTMIVDAALIVLAASAIMATAGMIILGTSATIAGAGMVIAGTGAVAAGAGLVVLAAGITAVGASLVVLSSGIMVLYSTITSIFSQIVSAVSSAMNNVVSAVSEGIKSAISVVKSVAGSLVSAGRDFVMGFVNGIKGAIGAAADAAANMAKSAVSAAKKFLHIHSPSRLMRDQVGYFVGAGMAVGIDKSSNMVADSSTAMAQDAYKAATNVSTPTLKAPEIAVKQVDGLNIGETMATGFTHAVNALDLLIGKLSQLDGVDTTVTGAWHSTPSSGPVKSSRDKNGMSTSSDEKTVNFNFGSGSIVVQTNGNESGEDMLEKIAEAARNYSNKGLAFG